MAKMRTITLTEVQCQFLLNALHDAQETTMRQLADIAAGKSEASNLYQPDIVRAFVQYGHLEESARTQLEKQGFYT